VRASSTFRRAGLIAAAAVAPFALAYRFAVVYRVRAGFPARRLLERTPGDLGLPFESTTVASEGARLAAWFVPARDGAPGPGVVIVHGWESARDRTLPHAQFLHAAGFHCLLIDVRGHGSNAPESLPISGGEFGADAAAGLRALLDRPEVTAGAILGHSMGAVGALLAAAAEESRCAAVVSVSAPADPRLLTRQTFRLARLPIPNPIAQPLAWLTAHVYVRPRGHSIRDVSARHAAAAYDGPILLVHGDQDAIIPLDHLERLEAAALAGRATGPATERVERLVVAGGQHSWLYEDEGYRRAVARFLATWLGGPYAPDRAADLAADVPAVRPPEGETRFAAIAALPVRPLSHRPRPGQPGPGER
jgi:alpha-beta hydrolase superfamily lysophospholipase